VFEGFLPLKKGRQTRLTELAQEKRTLVLYESPHKITKTLAEMAGIFGPERPACVAREISKMHETYHRGTLSELVAHFAVQPAKGELVLVVGGAL
jgi:16S rRNA (cytidine1402-2'-O)-methyltransferase